MAEELLAAKHADSAKEFISRNISFVMTDEAHPNPDGEQDYRAPPRAGAYSPPSP
jgi:hypothetical protein